jgi:hypothetical protein
MTGRRKLEGKSRECNEVKRVCAESEPQLRESLFWVWADPFSQGAGHAGGASKTSANCPPGVVDSIELHNGRQVTRRATSKGSWGNVQGKYSSMSTNVRRGAQMAASRVMGTGKPQRLAMRWA